MNKMNIVFMIVVLMSSMIFSNESIKNEKPKFLGLKGKKLSEVTVKDLFDAIVLLETKVDKLTKENKDLKEENNSLKKKDEKTEEENRSLSERMGECEQKLETPPFEVLHASTEPAHTKVGINRPTEGSKSCPPELKHTLIAIKDYGNMIRYTLEFAKPVDFLIPKEIVGSSNWYVRKHPDDNSGKKWVLSFQLSAKHPGHGKGYGRFLGIKFKR